MCRLLFLPSGITKDEALPILKKMYGDNEHADGTGEAYVGSDGKFVVNKYGGSLKKVLKKGKTFLDHLPLENGWTVVHLRKASIGYVSQDNAQPFESLNRKICLAHNGTVYGTNLLSMYLQNLIGYKGSSDSAAICELTSAIGARNLTDTLDYGGVFGILNLDGSLEISKVSGTLQCHILPNKKCILASEFDEKKYKNTELARGYYKFNPNGEIRHYVIKKFYWGGYPKEEKTKVWNDVHYQKSDGLTPLIPARYGGGATAKSGMEMNEAEIWNEANFAI